MTQRGAMIITWGEPRPGVPNSKGLEVFANALEYYDEPGQGTAASAATGSTPAPSRNHGVLVIEGELSTLAQIQCEEESMKQLALGSAVVQTLEVELCVGGERRRRHELLHHEPSTALAEAGLAT